LGDVKLPSSFVRHLDTMYDVTVDPVISLGLQTND
jgi:hypothetical protein